MVLNVEHLLDMTQSQLDELFRNSPAGTIPNGEGDGMVLLGEGTELSELAAELYHLFVWQGKVFYPEKGILYNRLSPLGIEASLAKVYMGKSVVDGKECIIVDYSQTDPVTPWARDEIRQLAPKLYLGIAYAKDERLFDFSLIFP
jgi:hypothetical protein